MATTRRDFLVGGASVGVASPFLGLGPTPWWVKAGTGEAADEIMVVVQMRGGWDFLNLIVAPDDSTYRQARPNLALSRPQVLPMTGSEALGWNPGMTSFRDLHDRGDLATILSVGYPNPNLSHFTSEKKWYTGDPTTTASAGTGWLSRWLKNGGSGSSLVPAIVVGSTDGAFTGSVVPTIRSARTLIPTIDNDIRVRRYQKTASSVLTHNAELERGLSPMNELAAKATQQAFMAGQQIAQAGANYTPGVTYPSSSLGNNMQLIASLIVGGLPTRVFYTDRGGFDMHSDEVEQGDPTQGALVDAVGDVGDSIKAFLDDMASYGKADKVVVLVFSEFGRRIAENGALGTEHGAGGVSFVAGKPVTGGLYGKFPDLSAYPLGNISNEYVKFTSTSTDFREVYATLLDRWLGVPSSTILNGTFAGLGFL